MLLTLDRTQARDAVIQRVPEAIHAIFRRLAPGRSFADLGCMWNAHAAYLFSAEQHGAVAPLMAFDMLDATEQFHAYREALGSKVHYTNGDILRLDPEEHGVYDVVFCSGVLYHMADPMLMLHRVTGITGKTLVLGTHALEGDEPIAKFYPHDSYPELYPWEITTGMTREDRARIRYGDWGPWWFVPTEGCVRQMLRCFGFEVEEVVRYPLTMIPGHPHNPSIATFVAHRID